MLVTENQTEILFDVVSRTEYPRALLCHPSPRLFPASRASRQSVQPNRTPEMPLTSMRNSGSLIVCSLSNKKPFSLSKYLALSSGCFSLRNALFSKDAWAVARSCSCHITDPSQWLRSHSMDMTCWPLLTKRSGCNRICRLLNFVSSCWMLISNDGSSSKIRKRLRFCSTGRIF